MFNFNNIGNKIKILAIISAILDITISVIYGIILIFKTVYDIGILLLIIGPIISWVSSFVLYGFGQLVDNSDKLVGTKNINNSTNETIINKNKNSKTTSTHITNKLDNDIDRANDIIKHLSLQDFENLKNKHAKWALEINRLSTAQLLHTINKEKNDWEDDYIFLCCFEILERNNTK